MTQLFVHDSTVRIGYSQNRIVITHQDGVDESYPIDVIDGVTIFGQPSMSTRFLSELLFRQIDLQMFGSDGHYVGRLASVHAGNPIRLRKQASLGSDEEFCLQIAKRLVSSKLQNQSELLRAHAVDKDEISESLDAIRHSLTWLGQARSISEVIGFEGHAAKSYFYGLSRLVPHEFAFSGRTTRPPRDAFNSMLSLGYSMLYKNITGAIERAGLHAFLGFMHQDKPGHAALASDIVEPWRALMVDDTVLRLVRSGQVTADMFTVHDKTGGVFASRDASRVIIRAFGEKIVRSESYLADDHRRYTFQYALDLQLQSLVRAVESGDGSRFSPMATMSGQQAHVSEES